LWILLRAKLFIRWSTTWILSRLNSDALLIWSLRLVASCSGAVVLLILIFLAREASPALATIGLSHFLLDAAWLPTENLFNLVPMLWGTVLVSLGALLLAFPAGLLSAAFLRFYSPPALAGPYRGILELLAGIPSVVYGLWGLAVLVPVIAEWKPPGASLAAGIVVLALMILPTLALAADAALGSVPISYLQAASALGFRRSSLLIRIVLPSVRPALLTAVLLASGRALGETMAVLMVCGNIVQTPSSIFDPIRTLTANIGLEMAYAASMHRSALFVSALFLMGLVVALVLVTERLNQERADA
jgi:phosphate transport system permease protein